jgi:CHAD domain-containing protein
MKQAQLTEIVTKRLEHMKKLSGQIRENFDIEDLHDLRVEYKKLRAFIRLVQLEIDASKLKVPGKLKSVYEAGGPVRDLQLFLPRLLPHFSQLPSKVYLERLENKLTAAKENLKQAIDKTSIEKVEETVLGKLPHNLSKETIKKFVQQKVLAIQTGLSAIHDDEDLHTIRKQLKDLIHVLKIYRNDLNLPFPVNVGISEEDLNHAGSLLGKYNDLCVALTFLQTNKEEGLPGEENSLLENLEHNLLLEKEEKQAEIIQKLTDLQMGTVQINRIK